MARHRQQPRRLRQARVKKNVVDAVCYDQAIHSCHPERSEGSLVADSGNIVNRHSHDAVELVAHSSPMLA